MFKRNNIIGLIGSLALISLLFTSCDDIIAKNISNETPELILPAVNDTFPTNPAQVKWEAVEGATRYRIEIVSPSFSNIQEFAIDSMVSGTNFFVDLDSNRYEVRITAFNAGYQSLTSDPRTFWVGSSAASSGDQVQLNNPANGAYINEDYNDPFSWFVLSGSASYTFELHEGPNFGGATLAHAPQLGSVNYTYTGPALDEGTYCWGVQAFDSNGEATIFSKRLFYVDTTDPGLASLSTPLNNASVFSGNISFTWQTPTDNGEVQSPLISVLQISTTSNFSSILSPLETEASGATYEITSGGTYYWRIVMKDEAGNIGTIPTSYRTLSVL